MPAQSLARTALLVPGMRYSVKRPLLDYARLAVVRRDGYAHELNWTVPALADADALARWVCDQVSAALDRHGTATRALVIGKSMGSMAASVVAERGLPAIWLTPLLHNPQVVAALRASGEPALLIGGTADSSWNGEIARSISPHTLEIADADHSMLVPGPLASSATVLGQVSAAIENFIDQIVWP